MLTKIYNILVSILGESKQGYYSKDCKQYQFNCPHCAEENGGVPDGKYNLEVSFEKMKFNCWKCGEIDSMRGSISYLIKRYGTPTQYREFKSEIDFLIKSKLYDISLFTGCTVESKIYNIKLPQTYTKINLGTVKSKKVKEYLDKRRISQEIIDKYKIGYTTWDEKELSMRNRIIIPSYNEIGELNYWVGRDFSGYQTKMKYKNCTADKKQIIFQESNIDFDADIVLCEGAIDCIYGPNFISLLGKDLQKDSYLYDKITRRANGRVIICLDNDTNIAETKRLYKILNNGRLKDKVWYIRLDKYKDFGEIYENLGKSGIIKAISSAKQFNEFELVI